jgi:hypothetical protein
MPAKGAGHSGAINNSAAVRLAGGHSGDRWDSS